MTTTSIIGISTATEYDALSAKTEFLFQQLGLLAEAVNAQPLVVYGWPLNINGRMNVVRLALV